MKALGDNEIYKLFKNGLEKYELNNKKILLITPDNTRSGPHYLFVKYILEILKSKVRKIDILLALGTHPLMSEEEIKNFFKINNKNILSLFKNVNIYNHNWKTKKKFKKIGYFSKEEIFKLTNGLFEEEVIIEVNRLIFEYDKIIILSPVFPHEVVGFSGGAKYFFPGISGWKFINFFHWWGALLTNLKINGQIYTPIRHLINKASNFIDREKILIALNLKENLVYNIFIGDLVKEWEKAAVESSKINIIYENKQYKKVLSIPKKIYTDLWTAAKAMYKLESIVEDGGELIIYAPQIKNISYTHEKYLKKIGYHIKEYFLSNFKKFKNIPRAVLAHSTHLKGIGKMINNIEIPRIKVTLATSISKEICKKINLDYIDYNLIKIDEWENRENEGIKVVHNAGEELYKFKYI